MKKKNLIFLILTFAAVAAVAFYVAKNASAFKKIIAINPYDAIPFVLLQIALIATNACVLLVYLSIFRSSISFFDSFGLNALHTFFNNILVKGGPVIKGYYLKRIHNLSYTDFVLAITSFTLMEVMVGGCLGILALLGIFVKGGRLNYYLLLFFILVLAAACAVIILPMHNIFRKKETWLTRKLFDIAVSWRKISADRTLMAKLFMLALLNFVIYALRLQYGFKILYHDAAFTDCLLISAAGTIANMFAVTPGGLGIREFIIGGAYRLINGDMLHAIVVTLLDRVVSTITIFALGVFFILYFLNKTKKVFFNPPSPTTETWRASAGFRRSEKKDSPPVKAGASMRDIGPGYEKILEDFRHNRSGRVRRQVKNVLELIGLAKDEDILEVGVATGKFTCMMSRANRVFALDISEENLKRARRTVAELGNLTNVFCAAGDCAAIPFYDSAFDRVIAIDIIEHLDDETCGLFCKEVRRVLKKGGRLCVYTPNLLHPYELARPFRPVMRREHIGVRTRRRIRRYLEDDGFMIEKSRFNNLFRRISVKAVKT